MDVAAATQVIDWRTVISLLALVFALASFLLNIYFQHFKPPKVGLALGAPMRFGFTRSKKLTLSLPINFFNDGTRSSVIHHIKCDLKKEHSENTSIAMDWTHFTEQITTRLERGEWKTEQRIISRVQPIILGGNSVVTQSIKFNSLEAPALTSGFYRITISAKSITAEKIYLTKTTARAVLTGENVNYLNEQCVANEKKRSKGLYMHTLNESYYSS